MEQKSVLVTGSNGGLGFGTVKALTQESSVGRIVMATRTDQSGNDAKKKLLSEIQTTAEVEVAGGFDMHKPDSIAQAVERLPKDRPFNIIFFQAGGATFTDDYRFIDYDGMRIEQTVFQNAVGAYLTLVYLMERDLVTDDARVVIIGGENARGVPGMNAQPIFESADVYRQFIAGQGDLPKYNVMYSMGVSKLSSLLLARKLAQREDGRSYIWFSPGLTHGTKGFAKGPALQRFFIENVMTKITGLIGMSQSADRGGQRCADCLLGRVGKNGDALGTPTGKLLGDASDQLPLNPSFTQQPLVDEFWDVLQSIRPMPN